MPTLKTFTAQIRNRDFFANLAVLAETKTEAEAHFSKELTTKFATVANEEFEMACAAEGNSSRIDHTYDFLYARGIAIIDESDETITAPRGTVLMTHSGHA